MREESLRLLNAFTQAHGAPGAESAVRRLFLRELAHLPAEADRVGNLYFDAAPPGGPDGPRVMLTAHMDEVGFMVQDITAEGFLKFLPLGGWCENTLLAQRVRVLTRAGREIPGVITSLPPHFTGGDSRTSPAIDKLYIDLGAESREQVRAWGVSLGDTLVPDGPFTPTAHPDRFLAKAFDNRSGCAALARALRGMKSGLPCRVLGVATVQEEMGCRGAQTAAGIAAPDVALVLEGPPADDTPGFSRAESQGRLGGGVQIRLYDPSAIMNRELAEFARATAERRGIPHQLTVRRSGGTDAKSIHLANSGIPTIVLGVPARYIHTHAALTDLRDFEACVDLSLALLESLDATTVAGFTKYL